MIEQSVAVLLIEDDQMHAYLLRKAFEQSEYDATITHAETLEDGRVLLRDMHFDVVIVDITLPDGSGMDILYSSVIDQCPVIIMTSHGDEQAAVSAIKAGAFDYVVKRDSTFQNMPDIIQHVLHEWENAQSYKRAEQVLKENEYRLTRALESAHDGMWDYTVSTGELYLSARWFSILGYDSSTLKPSLQQWFSLIYPEDKEAVSHVFDSACIEGADIDIEYRMKAHDDSWKWVLTSGKVVEWDSNGHCRRIIGTQADITARKDIETKLEQTAHHDIVTGLPNRIMFLEHLEKALKRSKRNKNYKCAVFFLDLDHFKDANDQHGHFAGDALLSDVGVRLSMSMRGNDIVARFAGDEFTILLDDVQSVGDVLEVVRRIQQSLNEPFSFGGEDIVISCSMGIVLSSESYGSGEEILRDADIAMYKAKSLGRDRFEIFDEHMQVEVRSQQQLDQDIRSSIEKNAFFLEYEPIIDLSTRHIVAVQTLVRWNHPDEGVILPAFFMERAEECGAARRIIEFALGRVMYDLRTVCNQRGNLRVFFDVNSSQLHDHGFAERVLAISQEACFPLSSLVFSFPEKMAAFSNDIECQRVHDLQRIVPNLAVRNFGAGFAPLLCLKRFPVAMIKIDGSFLQNVTVDARSEDMLRAIVAMSKEMRVISIADDVRLREHVALFARLGCDWAHGASVSPPIGCSEMCKMLDDEYVFV